MKNNYDNARIISTHRDDQGPRLMEVSIDCVVFGYSPSSLDVMLIEIGADDLKGAWALPGDRVYLDEDIDTAAERVLSDLTGLDNTSLHQAHAFGDANRVPEKRVVTIGYYSVVNKLDVKPHPSSWANKASWVSLDEIPQLTFDHNEIIEYALQKLRHRIRNSNRRAPLWQNVLPQHFTLTELQRFYEVVLNQKFDKGNFRKKLNDMPYLVETELYQEDVSHRPARLFTYDKKIHEELFV